MIKGHNLKQKYQRGFTIVELLIVIVIIGILAALVLNSFAGVQARARDTERQTDVRAISSQLEAWYNTPGTAPTAGNGAYPASGSTAGNYLYSTAITTTNLKGLDVNALSAPGQSSTITTAPSGSTYGTAPTGLTKDQYMYLAGNASGTTLCVDSTNGCAKFQIWWKSEVDGSTQHKDSLN